jgi:hypothetical protein
MSDGWEARTDFETVCRRAAGRRAFNAKRRFLRLVRRRKVFDLLEIYGLRTWGACTRIARELGVHRSTVARDYIALFGFTVRRQRRQRRA